MLNNNRAAGSGAHHWSMLEDTPLKLTRTQVAATFDPYVARTATKEDPEWAALVRRRHWLARRKLWKRRLLPWSLRRDTAAVLKEYGGQWQRSDYDRHAPPATRPKSGHPWRWGHEAYLALSVGGARVRLLYLMRVIEWLKPATVLEVGFGNAMNLLPLACRFPAIEFHGLELTPEGVARAKAVQAAGQIPGGLRDFSPEPLQDADALARIQFRQGSAAAMPFANGSYDLVFSSLALEQMESIRLRALSEMARVAARHTAMLEPFKEGNDAGLPRDYCLAMNYFRGTIADLERQSLRPILVTDDIPAEAWLQPLLVVCEKG